MNVEFNNSLEAVEYLSLRDKSVRRLIGLVIEETRGLVCYDVPTWRSEVRLTDPKRLVGIRCRRVWLGREQIRHRVTLPLTPPNQE